MTNPLAAHVAADYLTSLTEAELRAFITKTRPDLDNPEAAFIRFSDQLDASLATPYPDTTKD